MDLGLKRARTSSLWGAVSLILLASHVIAAELPELQQRNFNVGFQTLAIKDGKEITTTLVAATDSTRSWEDSQGCKWTTPNTGYAPSSKWSGCGGTDGEYTIKLTQGNPYPLKIGNSWRYEMDGYNANGNSWSDTRNCKVEGTEKVKTNLGKHDTYKVVCKENSSTRTYYWSLKLDYFVRIVRDGSRGYTWELKKIVSAGSAQ